ncbi:MAG: hypothetical protein ACPGRD_08025 [Planktomarina sp.]
MKTRIKYLPRLALLPVLAGCNVIATSAAVGSYSSPVVINSTATSGHDQTYSQSQGAFYCAIYFKAAQADTTGLVSDTYKRRAIAFSRLTKRLVTSDFPVDGTTFLGEQLTLSEMHMVVNDNKANVFEQDCFELAAKFEETKGLLG